MKRLILLCSFLCCASAFLSAADGFVLADQGKAACVIVTNGNDQVLPRLCTLTMSSQPSSNCRTI